MDAVADSKHSGDDPTSECNRLFTKTGKALQLRALLSDAGLYSYAAICALSLHELYNYEWDQSFNQSFINNLLQHLQLPKQVKGVMISLIEGQGNQSTDAYVELLLGETNLKGKSLLVVEDLVMMAVKGGNYDARMRVLIRHVSVLLRVPLELLELYEESVVEFLTEEHKELTEEEQQEVNKRNRGRKIKRYALIGLATLGGGAVLGLTGGLAAPLIGAGMGTILGGAGAAGAAAALGSTAGIAIIGSLFGVAGAGLTGFKMKKRVGEIEEFAFGSLTLNPKASASSNNNNRAFITQQLHISIVVSGWLSDDADDNFTRPWRSLLCSREQYYLRYESQYLLELGRAMEYILSFAVSMAAQEALKYTILSGLLNAIMWPASLITLASVIDNPWGVCCRRSAEVGKQLAEVLMAREQGQRPVTLIGFSLGARVIYYCLREMASRPGKSEGIVQDAILIGAPVTGSAKEWSRFARVVSGRLVNGYCRGDWLLKFLYRTFSMASGVAGLQPVNFKDRRMFNYDLSELVSGHSEYPEKMREILELIGIRTRSLDSMATADMAMKKSNSDLPGRPQSKISLLSLRRCKSDHAVHLCGLDEEKWKETLAAASLETLAISSSTVSTTPSEPTSPPSLQSPRDKFSMFP